MQLVLVVPGLVDAVASAAAAVHAPALADLLAWSGAPSRNADGLDAEIASRYGIARQTDWPLAAIRAQSLGLRPGDAYWLAADPVTLTVGLDDVAFSGIVDDLSSTDTAALVATLNAHFVGDGIEFTAAQPDALFARLDAAPRLATHPPAVTPERPLRLRLPEGVDAPKFRRWQSEVQMLLHEHPINTKREKNGRPPVNGVWFSMGGVIPPRPAGSPTPPIRTFASSGIAVALASYIGVPAKPLPASAVAALDQAADADLVVIALAVEVEPGEIERSWAAPARDALLRGRLAELSILAQQAGDALCWRTLRPGFWQRIAGRVRPHELATALAGAMPP